jgi:hypothetical protein
VNVNPAPASPTVAGNTICAGNNVSLTATAPGGTYQWYDAATGGNLLLTGSIISPLHLTAQQLIMYKVLLPVARDQEHR